MRLLGTNICIIPSVCTQELITTDLDNSHPKFRMCQIRYDRPKLRINSLHSRFVIYKACKFIKSPRNFFIRGGTDESIPHHLCLYTVQILTIFIIAVRKRKEINSENLQGGCYFHGASTLI